MAAASSAAASDKQVRGRHRPDRARSSAAAGSADGPQRIRRHRVLGRRARNRTRTASPRSSSTCRRTSPPGRSASGAWATARASARRRPRSSRARTSSSGCRRRGSSSSATKSCSSANVHNYLPTAKQVKVRLGARRQHARAARASPENTVEIPAGGEQRVDWRVKVAARRRSRHPHERPHRRRIRRHGDEVPGLRPRHAQDRVASAASIRPDERRRQVRRSTCRRSAAPSRRGWKSATRRRWPGRWSMPCPTSSTIPTAAPSRRSTASCRPSITQQTLLRDEARPEGDSREADEPQRPGNRRRRPSGPSGWKRFDRNPVFDEAELDEDGQGRRQRLHRDAALRRRLGLVQRLGRTVVRRTPRPSSSTACKSPSRTTSRSCPACWSAASNG